MQEKIKDDTISRQAAIDALYDWSEHSMTDAEAWHIRQVIGDIKSMPSAQPEIIRCKDCDYWNERQGRMYCGEMYFDQDDPNFYCGYARRRTDE